MSSGDVLDLDGRHLQLFINVLNSGNMTDAARDLGLDPIEAGSRLDQVRRSLGDELFIRVGRRLTPTEFATSIAPRVREHLASLEAIAAPRDFNPAEELGRITIAANVTEMLDEIILIRDAIGESAPLSRIRFLELGSRDRIEPMLSAGEADIVISVRAQEYASTLNGCAFASDKHVLFYDPSRRGPIRTAEDYADADHATLDFGGGGKSTIDDVLESQNVRRQVVLSAPDAFVLGALMRGTRLIATMQSRLGRTIFSHLASCEPPLYLPRQKFDLVWHRRFDNSPRIAWLRETILNASELSPFARA